MARTRSDTGSSRDTRRSTAYRSSPSTRSEGTTSSSSTETRIIDTATHGEAGAFSADDPTESIHGALVCGLRDYVRKCGFRKVVLGLSGGIDSAVVAALAAEAVGPENVLGVTMPSPYSSEGSIEHSRVLAEDLGIGSFCWTIDP